MSVQTKTCDRCQKVYPRKGYESDTQFALRQYCGVKCSRRAVNRMTARWHKAHDPSFDSVTRDPSEWES